MLIYLDEYLLVLNKPAGLLCVPGRGPDKQDCLTVRALQWAPDALVVHRLDMATSGLVVMARNKRVQRCLSDAFANRHVFKQYHALVHGATPSWTHTLTKPDDWFEIHAPLIADWPQRPLQKIDWEVGKPSQTRVRWIDPDTTEAKTKGRTTLLPQRGAPHSRVELRPLTGRSHQLRVHLLSQGHPIVGDALYDPNRPAPRLCLHATHLMFKHPVTSSPLAFFSPEPF